MDIRNVLKNAPLFSGLTDKELGPLSSISKTTQYHQGDEIFHEGSTETDLCLLAEGRVQVEVALGKADQATLHTIKTGDVFGEFALIDGLPRSATATSIRDSTILRITRADLFALFDREPRTGYVVMRNLVGALCQRIRKTTAELKVSLLWKDT